jgi:hypothetical protein
MTKEDKIRDRYYQKKYGITLDRYNEMLAKYDGCCWICRRPPTGRRLAVDHDHGHRYVKIKSWLAMDLLATPVWAVKAIYLGTTYTDYGPLRNSLIKTMRKLFKTLSCRGLLCSHCNLGLRKYADDPIRLANAAEYLRNHQGAKA